MTAAPADPERLQALVAAVQAGDAEALARWYRREHPPVWKLCLGLLADAHEADDAAQDAMLHLLDHLDAWDRRRAWSAWRNSVVLNHCRDRLRRGDARRRAESRAAELQSLALLPAPEEAASRGELVRLITGSLGILTPREREVFVLHDLEGETSGALAQALGLAESTVRVLLATARRRLRELLAPRLPELQPEHEPELKPELEND